MPLLLTFGALMCFAVSVVGYNALCDLFLNWVYNDFGRDVWKEVAFWVKTCNFCFSFACILQIVFVMIRLDQGQKVPVIEWFLKHNRVIK